MAPTEAAHLGNVTDVSITDVDPISGMGTVTFQPRDRREAGSVRINLLTGELSAIPSKLPKASKAETQPPLGTEDTLPSPSGRFVLEYTETPSPRLTIKDAKGTQLDVISNAPGISDVVWSPTEECFAFLADTGLDRGSDSTLSVYSVKQHSHQPVARGVSKSPQWSADGRLLVCLRTRTQASKNLPDRVRGNWGTIIVLDACSRFKQLLSVGKLGGDFKLSPTSSRIAFIELVRDEYGDYESYLLRIADVRTGRIRDLLTNRRKPAYAWAGDDTLAVTAYDKYAVPTLSLLYSTGAETKLLTARSFACLEPLAYLPRHKSLIYKAMKSIYEYEGPEELWAVEPGRQPVRIFPKRANNRESSANKRLGRGL